MQSMRKWRVKKVAIHESANATAYLRATNRAILRHHQIRTLDNMQQPTLNIKIDKEAEKETLRFFIGYQSRSGEDSFAILVRDYPELLSLREKTSEEQERIINEWVEKKYTEEKEELQKDLAQQKKILGDSRTIFLY